MAANQLEMFARIRDTASGEIHQVNQVYLDQDADGQAGGTSVATTTAQDLNLADITNPGQGWFLNLGSNDVSIGIVVSAVFYPILVVKADGKPSTPYFDSALKSTTKLQYKVASGTSPFRWVVWEQ